MTKKKKEICRRKEKMITGKINIITHNSYWIVNILYL